ncbi:hypothetical protein [Asticcacaulis solisilvae]|uniref:hypothetical protein n=1 Tax=Asticcacaulis solisilvae TaxID=1217274 RepID=UPI003FD7149B
MSASIVSQLVRKDFRLVRGVVLSFVLVSVLFIGILSVMQGHVPFVLMANLGFIMVMGPAATCGIVVLMKTNVMEKEKSTQAFIMSLPVTVKEFTRAKLTLNLSVFTVFWLAIMAVAYYFAFGRGLLPLGALPFVTMIFMGGFLAYTLILSVSLLSQALGLTVLCIVLFEVGTSASMWTIAYFPPIGAHIWDAAPVWNVEAVTVVAVQAALAVTAIATTMLVQNTRRDFI